MGGFVVLVLVGMGFWGSVLYLYDYDVFVPGIHVFVCVNGCLFLFVYRRPVWAIIVL